MTLAAILSVCILFFLPARSFAVFAASTQFAGQQASPAKTPDSPAQQSQDKPAGAQEPTPSASSPAGPAAGQNQPAQPKQRWRKNKKKKSPTADCNDSATATNSASGDSTPSGNSATANPSRAAAAPSTAAPATAVTASAPTNCPPAKIVVIHDGGISEPAIQLTGGAGGEQASNQRSTTDQLLASTEENLKKIAGRQLTSAQQEMVTQIRQFVDQSKAAVASKDMERGHTLAVKANLLSDELTKP